MGGCKCGSAYAEAMGFDLRRRQVCPDDCPFKEFSESGWLNWRVVQVSEKGAVVPPRSRQRVRRITGQTSGDDDAGMESVNGWQEWCLYERNVIDAAQGKTDT